MRYFTCEQINNVITLIASRFRPSVSLNYVKNELAFEDADEMLQFLNQFAIVYLDPQTIDCKNSQVTPSTQ